jgi:stage III sporulation protein AB
MRIIAALLSALLCIGTGRYFAGKMKRRERTLSDIVLILEEAAVKIRWLGMPVAQFIKEGSSRYAFLHCAAENITTNESWRTAWHAAADSAGELTDSDREMIKRFGEELGSSDVGGQIALIEANKTLFIRLRDEARAVLNKKGALYTKVSVLLGIGAALMLI